jgi:methionyl-tRNA synthetase
MKETIVFNDFMKLDIRVGLVLEAKKIEKSEKLILLTVDLGEEKARQIVAGIAKKYDPETLEGLSVTVIANLKEREIMGYVSQGMVLAVGEETGPVLITPLEKVAPGQKVS